MKKNKNAWLYLIIGGLLVFLLLDKCGSKGDFGNGTGLVYTDTVEVVEHKTHVDTITFIKDSIRLIDLPITSVVPNADSTQFAYTTEVSDSLLDGTINSIVKSDGTLVNQDFTYIPKFPKYITRTDSIFTERTITNVIEKPYWCLTMGAAVSVSPQGADLGPMLGFKTRDDLYFQVGYGLFNKSVTVSTQFNILRQKR